MNLLGTETYRNALAECLGEAVNELVVLSAFVTVPGYQWILEKIVKEGVVGKLVVRWRPNDLLTGASSLEVYEIAKEAGWSIFVYPGLHAKSILIDKSIVFVGSANVTGYGLSVVPGGNRELGVMFEASPQDASVFETILAESILVTDSIVEKMKLFLVGCPRNEYDFSGGNWPVEIERIFETTPEKLWVADMLWAPPENLFRGVDSCSVSTKESLHDLRALGLEGVKVIDAEILKEAFLTSRPWRWLHSQLLMATDTELYFGYLSSLVHNALLDDPGPYRKEVKELLNNLFLWVDLLAYEYVVIDVPGRKSQRLSLL